jgi:hypothetical protein
MKSKDIIIGKYYRIKSSPNYGYIKPLHILKPHTDGNTNSFIVVKCEHTVDKNGTFGFIRHFRLHEIIEG